MRRIWNWFRTRRLRRLRRRANRVFVRENKRLDDLCRKQKRLLKIREDHIAVCEAQIEHLNDVHACDRMRTQADIAVLAAKIAHADKPPRKSGQNQLDAESS